MDRLLHGDFGTSWATISFFGGSASGSPVGPMVWRAALVTGSLLLGGFVLMLLVAVPLGTFAATRPRSFVDRLSLGLGVAAISTHPLVVGLLLQLFVGNRWKLLPASGYCTVSKPSPQLVAEAARTAPTGTPLPVRRRRAVGVASAPAVADVRAVLRRALHADRAGADARGARRAVGEDCAGEGRVGAPRDPRARAAQCDRAGRDDGRDGRRNGDRCRDVRRDRLRPAGARPDADPRARRPAGLRPAGDPRDHARRRGGDHRAQPDRRPRAARDRSDRARTGRGVFRLVGRAT